MIFITFATVNDKLRSLIVLGCMLTLVISIFASDKDMECPVVKIQPERLPDLKIPRSAHHVLCLNGEVTAIGGHTTAFVPTPTLEYYKDGEWHVLQMAYAHNDAIAVPLFSGKVLIAGGYEKPLGIGQTYSTEIYDPVTHTFGGFGCLDRRRAQSMGVELDSGKVMIAGNWYHDDGIEMFDGRKSFTYVKDVETGRGHPFLLRTAKDDAIIFGGCSIKGDSLQSSIVERLKGDPINVPLLEQWHPKWMYITNSPSDYFIGDEERGVYTYLLPVENNEGQIAIAQVSNGEFSLLPLACTIPMKSPWGQKIEYAGSVVVDRQSQRGYLFGRDILIPEEDAHNVNNKRRIYILCVEYGKAQQGKGAPMTLYYTEPMPENTFHLPVVTKDGDLMIVGGNREDNYTPMSTVLLFRMGLSTETAEGGCRVGWWLLLSLGVLLIIAALLFFLQRHRHRRQLAQEAEGLSVSITASEDMVQRVCELFEKKKLYLNSDLKVSDVAAELRTNTRYVSECIKMVKGYSFPQFINGYRVDHAKQLLRDNPDMKIATVCIESGFANEASFFRTFKVYTGMTPREWMAQTDKNHSLD